MERNKFSVGHISRKPKIQQVPHSVWGILTYHSGASANASKSIASVAHTGLTRLSQQQSHTSILLTFLTKNISWRGIVMLRLLPLLRLAISLPVEPADKTSVSWRYGHFFLLCHPNISRKVISAEFFEDQLMLQTIWHLILWGTN